MLALRDFESTAIRLMAGDILSEEQLVLLEAIPLATRYEYTGSGYFLTLSHPSLPVARQTLSMPAVIGESGEVRCGFVVFLGDAELILECHTWGEVDVPSGFRELQVAISTSPINVVDLRH